MRVLPQTPSAAGAAVTAAVVLWPSTTELGMAIKRGGRAEDPQRSIGLFAAVASPSSAQPFVHLRISHHEELRRRRRPHFCCRCVRSDVHSEEQLPVHSLVSPPKFTRSTVALMPLAHVGLE